MEWENVVFEKFLAPGGFEISASRKDGKTEFVTIQSHAGEPYVIKIDFTPERVEGIEQSAVKRLKEGVYSVSMNESESVTLFARGVKETRIEAVDPDKSKLNSFGLN
ncbi:hypothetical protein ACFPK9_14435 [Rubritalea spongiae]|uniref:Uncharacterized protein n=1 Tax=Rubritalea spongiae TaxID=430797 RepID=A0ABW5E284_9BACT